MKFVLWVIQNFRYSIVHNHGICQKGEILKELLKKIGLTDNSDDGKEYIKYFNRFFPNETNDITLLEILVFDRDGIKASTEMLGDLFMALQNSAYHIKNEIKEQYGL